MRVIREPSSALAEYLALVAAEEKPVEARVRSVVIDLWRLLVRIAVRILEIANWFWLLFVRFRTYKSEVSAKNTEEAWLRLESVMATARKRRALEATDSRLLCQKVAPVGILLREAQFRCEKASSAKEYNEITVWLEDHLKRRPSATPLASICTELERAVAALASIDLGHADSRIAFAAALAHIEKANTALQLHAVPLLSQDDSQRDSPVCLPVVEDQVLVQEPKDEMTIQDSLQIESNLKTEEEDQEEDEVVFSAEALPRAENDFVYTSYTDDRRAPQAVMVLADLQRAIRARKRPQIAVFASERLAVEKCSSVESHHLQENDPRFSAVAAALSTRFQEGLHSSSMQPSLHNIIS